MDRGRGGFRTGSGWNLLRDTLNGMTPLLPEPKPQRPAQPDDMLGLRDLFKEGMGDSPASCAADLDDS